MAIYIITNINTSDIASQAVNNSPIEIPSTDFSGITFNGSSQVVAHKESIKKPATSKVAARTIKEKAKKKRTVTRFATKNAPKKKAQSASVAPKGKRPLTTLATKSIAKKKRHAPKALSKTTKPAPKAITLVKKKTVKIPVKTTMKKIETQHRATVIKPPTMTASLKKEELPQAPRPVALKNNKVRRKTLQPPTPNRLLNISRGGTEKKELALTFDGGDAAREATEILNTLAKKKIKTTIFLSGTFIKKNPDIVRRIVWDGHEVGNHSMNHPHLTDYETTYRHNTLPGVTKELVLFELRETAKIFKETTGMDMAPYWRAPYGEINAEITQWAKEGGYMHVGWTMDHKTRTSLDTLDWIYDRSSELYLSASEIKERILAFDSGGAGLKGGIILMHLGTSRDDDRAATILAELIDDIELMGFRFVKVSDIESALKLTKTEY